MRGKITTVLICLALILFSVSINKRKAATDTSPDERPQRVSILEQFEDRTASSPSNGNPLETPINFWGRVVDPGGEPIADATVAISATDSRNSNYSRQSDSAGDFEITGIQGFRLRVKVSKDGYAQIAGPRGPVYSVKEFYYDSPEEWLNNTLPSESNPAVFTLRKRIPPTEVSLIEGSKYKLDQDGESREIAIAKDASVIASCKTAYDPNSNRPFDWWAQLRFVGASVCEDQDLNDRMAPVNGYVQDVAFGADDADPNWSLAAGNKVYWVRFDSGIYGWLKINLQPRSRNSIGIQGMFNPVSGERSLDVDYVAVRKQQKKRRRNARIR